MFNDDYTFSKKKPRREEEQTVLYYCQFDGIARRRSVFWSMHKGFIRICDSVGVVKEDKTSVWMDVAHAEVSEIHAASMSMTKMLYRTYISAQLDAGWGTNLANSYRYRSRILFDKKEQDEDHLLMFCGVSSSEIASTQEVTYWRPQKGKMCIITRGDKYVYGFDREWVPMELPLGVVSEIAQLYSPGTCLKGVLHKEVFYLWEYIAKDGKDACSFTKYRDRIPKYSGESVQHHTALEPWEASGALCLATNDDCSDITIYSGCGAVQGVWLVQN